MAAEDDWVAVEPEFQNMTTKIKPVTSAFMFFQKHAHEQGIGLGVGMSERMKVIAEAWRNLDETEKAKFNTLSSHDRARYNKECEERDTEVRKEQERKREARDGEVTEPRKKAAPKEQKARVARVYSKEELEARAAKKAARQEKLDEIAGQAAVVDASLAEKAQKRLQYLLSQSDVFSAFGVGKKADPSSTQITSSSSTSEQPPSPSKRRERAASRGDSDDEGGDNMATTRLLKQPSCISGGEMRPYQLEGLNWLIKLQENGVNGILADEMGLGKTLQSISILAFMHQFLNIKGPHLVLVPKSTLPNWMKEFKRWCPVLRVIGFHGDKESRATMVKEVIKPGVPHSERSWDIMVTTYEVCNMELSVLTKLSWYYLIIDEAHRIKNESSMFSKSIRALKTLHRLLLTGTPLQNNLHELWALLNFMLPDVFEDAEQFDSLFNLDIDDAQAKQNMISMLHKILRPFMLRRLKADVEKSLPPKSEIMIFTSLSKLQRDVYKNVLRRELNVINGDDKAKSKSGLMNICMHLRKACNHPYLFDNIEDRTLDPLGEHLIENCGKMKLLDKLLKKMYERGNRVLVFSQMTRMLDILEDYLIMRGYHYCRIDGDTSYEARQEQIDDYNSPDTKKFIFLLSTRAGGLGINLQTADTVVLYDSDWNPQCDLQAMDRAHRIGQKKQVNVYRLVTESTIEEKVVTRAQQKLKLDAMVVQQGRLQQKETLSKDTLMDALRFGAEKIFKALPGDEDVTEDDIDAILDRGKKLTNELMDKLVDNEKGDMLDFKLDGGMNVQTFEGEDYSRDHGRDKDNKLLPIIDTMLLLEEECSQARVRKQTNYSESGLSGDGGGDEKVKQKIPKYKSQLPPHLKIPSPLRNFMLFQDKRLLEIGLKEEANYLAYIAKQDTQEEATNDVVITSELLLGSELASEKEQLLKEGFVYWKREHFNFFLKSCSRYGRNDIDSIAHDFKEEYLYEENDNKDDVHVRFGYNEIKRYSEAFFSRGLESFGPTEFNRIIKNIEKREKKLEEIIRLTNATRLFLSRFEDPYNEMIMYSQINSHVNTSTDQTSNNQLINFNNLNREFSFYEDKCLLNLVNEFGYGNWIEIQQALYSIDTYQHPDLQFDYTFKSLSIDMIMKRCDILMKQIEKEIYEYDKKINKDMIDNIKYNDNKNNEIIKLSELSKRRNVAMTELQNKINNKKLKYESMKEFNNKIIQVKNNDTEQLDLYEKEALALKFIQPSQAMLQDSLLIKDASIVVKGKALPAAMIMKKKDSSSSSSSSKKIVTNDLTGGNNKNTWSRASIPFPNELTERLITDVIESVSIKPDKCVDNFFEKYCKEYSLSKKCIRDKLDAVLIKDSSSTINDTNENKTKKIIKWRKKTDIEIHEHIKKIQLEKDNKQKLSENTKNKIMFPKELVENLINFVIDSVSLGIDKNVEAYYLKLNNDEKDKDSNSDLYKNVSKRSIKMKIEEILIKSPTKVMLENGKEKMIQKWRKKTESELHQSEQKKITLEIDTKEKETGSPKKNKKNKNNNLSVVSSPNSEKKKQKTITTSNKSETKKVSSPKKRKEDERSNKTTSSSSSVSEPLRAPKKPKTAQSLFNIEKRSIVRKAMKDIDPACDIKTIEDELKKMWEGLADREEWEVKAAAEALKYKKEFKAFKEKSKAMERDQDKSSNHSAKKLKIASSPKRSESIENATPTPTPSSLEVLPSSSSSSSTTPKSSIPKKVRSASEDADVENIPKKLKPLSP